MITVHVGPGQTAKQLMAELREFGEVITATDQTVTVPRETAAKWLAPAPDPAPDPEPEAEAEPESEPAKKTAKQSRKTTTKKTPEGGDE